jgi:hypothetical protein
MAAEIREVCLVTCRGIGKGQGVKDPTNPLQEVRNLGSADPLQIRLSWKLIKLKCKKEE